MTVGAARRREMRIPPFCVLLCVYIKNVQTLHS